MEFISLIEHPEKYSGKYVAKKSFQDLAVISAGSDPQEVMKEAQQKGVKDPVVFYIPEKDLLHIY